MMELLVPAAVAILVALIGTLEAPLAMRSDVNRLSSLVESRERLKKSPPTDPRVESSLDNLISVLAANIESRELESVAYKACGKAEATRTADATVPGLVKVLLWAGALALAAGAVGGIVAVGFRKDWSAVALAVVFAGWLVIVLAGSYQVLRELVARWRWRRAFIRKQRKELLVALGLAEAEQGAAQTPDKGA